MTRLSFYVAMMLGTVLGCQGEPPTTGCPTDPLALCALRPTLVVTGRLRRAAEPIPGAEIRATAYAGACGNQVADVLPSPADEVTDETGIYTVLLEPRQAASPACLRVASTDPSISVDVAGLQLQVPPAAAETLTVNLDAP